MIDLAALLSACGAYSKCFLDEVADAEALLRCCTNSDSAGESAIVACVLLP